MKKVDEKVLWLTKGLFEQMGCFDMKIMMDDEFSHHDLEGKTKKNENIQIEVKGRNYPSTAFPDHIVNVDKMGHLTSAFTDTVRVVCSVYSDNVMKMTRVDGITQFTAIRRKAPHTTAWGGKDVNKYDVHLVPDVLIYFNDEEIITRIEKQN